ncbi:MAG: 2-dehydropantoate 2-reductase [Gammaproteobacteria bacterium]|nr:MAG: 2-dehydropantoate 2-reductase [Gammaproteobacteria bacterium]
MNTACVFGLGAIGSYLAARLALSGVRVTAITRGATLEAVRARGLVLVERGRRETVQLRAVASPQEAGQQEVVFLTVKANDLPVVASQFRPLLGPATAVVTVGNGFPWWYFFRATPGGINPTLTSVDPRGSLWRLVGPEHAIGCVVYPAVRVAEPGVVEHIYGNRFSLGEPDGSLSTRVRAIAAMLSAAALEAPVRQDIRTEIWTKLTLNAAYNPVSLLTGATLGQMLDDLATAGTLEALMQEAIGVAATLGVRVPMQPRQLMELTRPLSAHKTSSLQDLEAGRRIELDPVAGAVAEIGRLRNVRTPALDAMLALARLRARLSGCHG